MYPMEHINVNVQTDILVQNVNIVSRKKNEVDFNLKFIFDLVSGCFSSPCRNNGQCVATTTNCSLSTCSVECICVNGTRGNYCEQIDTSCLTEPCQNGGYCITNSLTNISYCQCPTNTIGSR